MFVDATPVLYVEDIEAALDFFCQGMGGIVGFRWPREGAATFAVVSLGRSTVSLGARDELAKLVPNARLLAEPADSFELAIEVEDLEAAIERLTSFGARIVEPPALRAWGERNAWMRAPTGHLLQLYRRA